MIKAVFYTKESKYFGFKISGHANYGCCGRDVVCAGTSALVINTVNSLEELTTDCVVVEEYDSGLVKCKVTNETNEPGEESQLLIKALRIGLCSIYEEYGDKYIQIYFREVKSC